METFLDDYFLEEEKRKIELKHNFGYDKNTSLDNIEFSTYDGELLFKNQALDLIAEMYNGSYQDFVSLNREKPSARTRILLDRNYQWRDYNVDKNTYSIYKGPQPVSVTYTYSKDI